ncbi:MAG: SBBP repeat-containing protein, partial [Bacteroidetes bacterium]|nr:SBBP repeat-containing protein [Bacteroidota bacterium]
MKQFKLVVKSICSVLMLLAFSTAPVVAQANFITEIIDATGDGGGGNAFLSPQGIAVDGSGNVYVAGVSTDNAFKITPGGVITEIIDATGDGVGNPLKESYAIAVDGSGNVYVTGRTSNNAFKITPGGLITEIIDATGDGTGTPVSGNPLEACQGIAVDSSGN